MYARGLPMGEFEIGPSDPPTQVFDLGHKTIVDLSHVRVERLDTDPVLFSKVFKQFEDRRGQKYDYRYWAERENFFLREFLKKRQQFSRVVQPRHLISENEAAKQVLTCDAGITVANWLRVKPRYGDGGTLSHPFQRPKAWLFLVRAGLLALKQIHEHGIVHCDIKEDNICVPYAPYPWADAVDDVRLAFDELKLIDFAFSIAHWMPLTQILVINPEDRAPYQSARLVQALRADRLSGFPDAVQQLDYGVDLFSLGYMAEKIMGTGLDCPPGAAGLSVNEGARSLVHRLKGAETCASATLPHDDMVAQVEDLLACTVGFPEALTFKVAGEWRASEMRPAGAGMRRTPLTPVAPPVPTPVALPAPVAASLPDIPEASSEPQGRAPVPSRMVLGLIIGLTLALLGSGAFLALRDFIPAPMPKGAERPATPAPAPDPYLQAAPRIDAAFHGDDDLPFQTAWSELARFVARGKAAAVKLASKTIADYDEVLNSTDAHPSRVRAYRRLQWLAANGSSAAAERVSAFESGYDQIKKSVATSAWWARGEGGTPAEAPRWMDNGAVLAANGDRPAQLDQAYARGTGRGVRQDRAAAAQMYLTAIARAQGADETSVRIRSAAAHGLAAILRQVAEEQDQAAAAALVPVLSPMAARGAADMSYYLGLFSECVTTPHDLAAARRYYHDAAADPAWKPSADRRVAVLGKSCPARAG